MLATSTTFFIVDDDDFVRDALKTLLKSAGFKVEVFGSAQAFLDSGHYNGGLLILDVRMPGMDGLALQKKLVALGATLPIIFITAHEDIQARTKAMAAGAAAFLQKPLEDSILFGCIDRILNQGGKERKNRIL